MSAEADSHIIDELYAVLKERRKADPKKSYTAKLYAKGTSQISKKLGEEAVEVAIAAMEYRHDVGKKKAVVEESVDLIYHLMVLWADLGIKPKSIYKVFEKRFGVSGIAEKASRDQKKQTDKKEKTA